MSSVQAYIHWYTALIHDVRRDATAELQICNNGTAPRTEQTSHHNSHHAFILSVMSVY